MTSNIYINNRKKLISLAKEADYILIGGNALLSKSSDVNFEFRQDSNMLYLSGINEPSSSLLIDIKQDKNYIVLPNKSKIQEYFDGAIGLNKILKISGCDDALDYKQLKFLLKNQKIYYNLPPKTKNWGVFSNPFRAWIKNYLRTVGVEFIDIRPEMIKLRMIKQDYEIAHISKAVEITKEALHKLEPMIWLGHFTEQDLAYKFTKEFAGNNTKHAYEPIVATGANAAVLHHVPDSRAIDKSKNILIDVGAEFNGYAADISRTFTKEPDKILEDLLKAQTSIIKMVKPGIYLKDLHISATNALNEIAIKHSLKDPIKELFPHAIGHHLGLDVHDVADYKQPLEENMVITIEPGIYSAKQGFGYRVEDDILVTKNGSKVL